MSTPNVSAEKEYNRVKSLIANINKANRENEQRLRDYHNKMSTVNQRIPGIPREVGQQRARERNRIRLAIGRTQNNINKRLNRGIALYKRLNAARLALRQKHMLANPTANAVYNQIVAQAKQYF